MSARPQIKLAASHSAIDDRIVGDRDRVADRGSSALESTKAAATAPADLAAPVESAAQKDRAGGYGPSPLLSDQPHAPILHRRADDGAGPRRWPAVGLLAGKPVRFGPIAFWSVVGTLVVMAIWSIAAASYFAFNDDVVTRLIVRENDLQVAYEDRLAEMRTQVDQIITRQLLDHEKADEKLDRVDQKLEQAMRRQSMLEQRAAALGALGAPGEPSSAGSAKPNPRRSSPEGAPAKKGRDTARPKKTSDRHSLLAPGAGPTAPAADPEIDGKIVRLISSLDRVEQRQLASLNSMEQSLETKIHRLRSLLAEIGISPGRGAESGTGGPYVPVRTANSFEEQIRRVQLARAQLERLNKTVLALPLRRPVSGQIDMSSPFGSRIDPFLGRPAFHTGIDFRGNIGEAIRATGSGVVVSADWSGGYGRMVEIDHGHGLTTRYGHLSNIAVQVGQLVKTGEVIGRMGSTGRSTGPHLHYETRIDGEATDPQRFLRAGFRMSSL